MKLIINVPEELYTNIVEDNCSMADMRILLTVIKNSILLDDISTEIKNNVLDEPMSEQMTVEDMCLYNSGLYKALSIIYKHIGECDE